MTSPDSPSPTRPLRVAGLALLGLAAAALVIGLVSVFGGADGDGDEAAGPPATTANGTSTPGESPPTSPTSETKPPTTTTSEAPATTPPGEPSGSVPAPPPGGDGNGEPGKTQPVRVYNNSTISGLAAQVADDLRAVGWNVVEAANYPYGTIPTTTVYYRPGTAEQAAAGDIAGDFGMRVEQRFTGIEGFPPGVVVIVTNDYQGLGGSTDGK